MTVKTKKTYAGKFNSTVLSVGETFAPVDRSVPLTVDKSNAQRQFKKPVGQGYVGCMDSFDMFKPADASSVASASRKRAPTDAKMIYSDPFSEDRSHYQPPVKRLLEPDRSVGKVTDHHVGACRKHVESNVKDGQYKEKLITANGNVHGGGKHFQAGKHTTSTTFDKTPPKPKDFASMIRYRRSSEAREEARLVSPIRTANSAANDRKFAKGSNGGATLPGHGGTKRVESAHVAGNNSLAGVLRLGGAPKAKSNHNYRPPWATNTPRATAPRGDAATSGYSAAMNAPFATTA